MSIHNNVFDGEFPDINKLVKANAKSRLRMLTLYALANQAGYLVAGTTNKSEMKLGYATKYGDGGVDFEPIQDFYKTEVWEMATLMDLPKAIIDKAPSAGLWAGQTDEDELGHDYYEIDAWLQGKDKQPWTALNRRIKTAKHKDLHLPYFRRD